MKYTKEELIKIAQDRIKNHWYKEETYFYEKVYEYLGGY